MLNTSLSFGKLASNDRWVSLKLLGIKHLIGCADWTFAYQPNHIAMIETHSDDPLLMWFEDEQKMKKGLSQKTIIDLLNHDYQFEVVLNNDRTVIDEDGGLITVCKKFRYHRSFISGEFLSERQSQLPTPIYQELQEVS